MNEPAPIDHKDEPGEYRRQVRAGVFSRIGCPGELVTRQDQLIGSWDVAFVGLEPITSPMFVYHLHGDGTAVVEGGERNGSPSVGEWRLNPDGTFSLLTWCPAAPEYGIDEPQLDEDRRHLATLAGGRLAMWNGDGSMLLLLSPRGEGTAAEPAATSDVAPKTGLDR